MKCGDEKTKQVFTFHNISDLSLCWSLTQLVFCCNFTNKKCLSNYSLSIPMCEKGDFRKKSRVSTGVRKQGNTCASQIGMI